MGRAIIEIPKGFKRSTLKRNEFLLVKLVVKGTVQSNCRTAGGTALLLRSFNVVPKITTAPPPKGYRDLSDVLPRMGKIVSVNTELAQDFANHLWHLGVDASVYKMKKNYDLTGRRYRDEEWVFQWYLKGPIGITGE